MATMNVKDAAGSTVAVEKPLTPGQATMANSRPVVLASDQASIPVAATLAAETTKVIGTVRTASGGIASGSVASGAYAAGSIAAGAGVDGWDLTQGAIADASVTAGATGSISAKLRRISADIGSLVTAIGSTAWDLGSGVIGSRTQRIALATDSPGVLGNRTTAGTVSNGFVQVGIPTDLPLPAGEIHLGEVGGKSSVFSVTLSTDTSAYASGDLIADTQQMDAFFRKADGTGVINSISIIDEDAQGVALYVIFMKTSTSLGTENSAPNISDANLSAGMIGIVPVATTDYVTCSGAKIATIKNIGLPVMAVSGTDDLYIAILNATGTPTFTASGLKMRIGALLD
jgi:hypothetical protein